MRPFREICEELYASRARKTELNRLVEEEKARYSALDKELQDALMAAGLDRITVDGYNYAPRSACVAKIEDQDALIAWCKTRDLDPMMFFMQSVAKVRSYIRERNEDGGEIPDGISDVLPINVIGITKAGTKK